MLIIFVKSKETQYKFLQKPQKITKTMTLMICQSNDHIKLYYGNMAA